jgi:hypothetical protein
MPCAPAQKLDPLKDGDAYADDGIPLLKSFSKRSQIFVYVA